MKGLAILLGLLLLSPALRAEDTSPAFRNAFSAYVKLRRLEDKSRIAQERRDLEEGDRLELSHKATAELTEARADFETLLHDRTLSAWEKTVLGNAGKISSAAPLSHGALDFLSRSFGQKAKAWSPVEWQCAGEWFGKATEDAFLKTIFAMEPVPDAGAPAPRENAVLWISDPMSRYLSKAEAQRLKAQQAQAKVELEKRGYSVEDLEIGAFARLDEQAEDLHLALSRRIDSGNPFTLVSTGNASAILLRTLDLNPGLLGSPEIRGWVNVNGQLFGGPAASTRAPASESKADGAENETRHELLLLRQERLEPQTPLGAKFPVLNLITLAGAHRPGASLRDSLLPDARTVYLHDGDGLGSLRRALPLLQRRAPAGQRDPVSGLSL